MALQTEPCGWVPDFTGCLTGPCCPDVDDPTNAAVKALAISVAQDLLWALTGRRYGCCELIVRPCKPITCKPIDLTEIIYWDQRYFRQGTPTMGVLSYFPTLVGGEVFNISCGCPVGCCTCRADCEFPLPGPVCAVSDVSVDGTSLATTDWMILDNHVLVFQNGTCPGCQNYNLDNGEVGTWSVTYTLGEPVPAELNLAAGMLACEIAKSLLGQSCSLPSRVQNVTRQGIDVAFFDPIAFTNEGLTGIPFVDMVIRALNPYRMAQASRVWSPDLPITRRET